MTQEVMIIGCGMGGENALKIEAQYAIKDCELLLGAPRLLAPYDIPQKLCLRIENVLAAIQKTEAQKIGVLVSGDPGFFSAAKKLVGQLGAYRVRIIPGISSLSYFCAQFGESWDDIYAVSVHGRRDVDIIGAVAAHKKRLYSQEARIMWSLFVTSLSNVGWVGCIL
jgi:precorrin-6Y C5,15-methyltransferase (decarboxylating)